MPTADLRIVLAGILAFLFAVPSFAASVAPNVAADDEEVLDPIHHVADGHYLDFSPGPKIQLPRIFIVRDEAGSLGIKFFRSGEAAVASGLFHAPTHDDDADHDTDSDEHADDDSEAAHDDDQDAEHAAADTDSQETQTDEHAAADGEDADGHAEITSLVPASGQLVADLSITRHIVFAWLIAALLFISMVRMARRYSSGVGRETAPKGKWQNTVETMVLFVRDEIARPNIGPTGDRYVPFLLTVFFFILGCNLIGLVPFSATATANITVTAVLAIFTFVVVHWNAKKDYWMHILWPPGIPMIVKPILIPIEIIGIFIKPFVLAVRLFANMTAGHLVILSLIGLIFVFKTIWMAPVSIAFSLFIYLLEILVAFLQAYIFAMLSALYIGAAVEEHDHHEEHHAAEELEHSLSPA